MSVRKQFHYLLTAFLMIVFPLFIWSVSALLKVNTVDVSGCVTQTLRAGAVTEIWLELPEPEPGERYELMFETEGNVVEIRSSGQTVYTYGREAAAEGRMLGSVFVHAFLPDTVYGQPLFIRLTAADHQAEAGVSSLELCRHTDSLRYYVAHGTLGLPLAMVLISMAFAIPVFLLLGNERRLLYEGLLLGGVLICCAALLLGRGGHFLLFFADQLAWARVQYLAMYLLPALILLYFRTQEKRPDRKRFLGVAALLNGIFALAAAGLGLTETVALCDLSPIYFALLLLDAVAGVYVLCGAPRRNGFSGVRLVMLGASTAWAAWEAGKRLLTALLPNLAPLDFDPLELYAICLFYGLCFLFAESAFRVQRDAENISREIAELRRTEQNALSTTEITREMLAYESIYVIDAGTGAYTCYYETSAHGDLGVASSGEDFYATMADKLPGMIDPEDLEFVAQMLSRNAVLAGTASGEAYAFIYRIRSEQGVSSYRKIRAVRRMIGGQAWILLGVRDIDAAMRREKAHMDQRASMLQKEMNHLDAILASAAGYLEVNLTRDLILDRSHNGSLEDHFPREMEGEEGVRYSLFIAWWAEHMVVENREAFLEKNDVDYLIGAFDRGEKRTSVSFSARSGEGAPQPCRQVMYLYRDSASGDVMCFHVVYDLTEQQRREKERQELEQELRMSRIRVFTGQMQPHFLYNALGSIQEVILYDPEYASELLGDFTIHLRGSIRAMSSDKPIPFAQEMENVRAYTNIERMRFGKKLEVSLDLQAKDFSILPLSIQPLVENAIRHGIYERGARGGRVTVQSLETADSYQVSVQDDGVGFDAERVLAAERSGESQSTGLKNVIFRLEKVMGAQVHIHSELGVGTHILVTLPKGGKKT